MQLLDELGLRRTVTAAVYDERHLCHSPQERHLIDGHWHEGLLPPDRRAAGRRSGPTQAQYRRSQKLVDGARARRSFTIPDRAIDVAARTRRAGRRELRQVARLDSASTRPHCAGTSTTAAATTTVPARRGVRLGRPALLREPPRLSRTGIAAGGARRRADLAGRQCMAHDAACRARCASDCTRPQSRCACARGRHGVEVDAWNAT
jgi:hypothetical protein